MTGKLLSNALVGALANRCCVQTEFFGRCVYLYNFVVASCTGASKVLTTIAIKMNSNVVVRKKKLSNFYGSVHKFWLKPLNLMELTPSMLQGFLQLQVYSHLCASPTQSSIV